MLTALMIGAHNSVSARAFAASSSGVEPLARTPITANLAFTAGSSNILTMSAFILLTISRGVLAASEIQLVTIRRLHPKDAGLNWKV